ncbi:MAG TPA: hypothetical protein VHP33_31895 [Polyangiaceae bacterium]|nr:hypothetical protein [Polyangiaceae bacterium]
MTDPTPMRLMDEAGGDDLELSLLQLARSEGPSMDGRRKILAGIAAASAASLTSQQAQAASTAGKGLTAAKWGVLAVAAVAIPAAILLRGGDDASAPLKPAPSALKAPATEVKATPLPAAPVEAEGPAPLALEDLPTLPSVAPATGSAPSKQAQGSLADEVAQLQKAKLALKGGSPAQALAELATYAQRFPRPMLGAEATVLRIEALSQSGDKGRAKSLAEGFLAKNPNSPYAARLRSVTGAQ